MTGRVWPTVIPLPHTLLSSALGLLLVFRTNAAYDRFWEARCSSNPDPTQTPNPEPEPEPEPEP